MPVEKGDVTRLQLKKWNAHHKIYGVVQAKPQHCCENTCDGKENKENEAKLEAHGGESCCLAQPWHTIDSERRDPSTQGSPFVVNGFDQTVAEDPRGISSSELPEARKEINQSE